MPWLDLHEGILEEFADKAQIGDGEAYQYAMWTRWMRAMHLQREYDLGRRPRRWAEYNLDRRPTPAELAAKNKARYRRMAASLKTDPVRLARKREVDRKRKAERCAQRTGQAE